jgi:uncharacterized protein YceK
VNTKKSPFSTCLSFFVLITLSGCTTTETRIADARIADGQSVRAIMAAQTNDADATTRHGTTTPSGTDSEVAEAAVKKVRERSRESGSKSGLMDLIFGGAGRK